MTKLYASRGRPVHDERRIRRETARVKRAAVVEQPTVLFRPVSQDAHMRQRVQRQGVVQFPVDRPS